MAIVGSVRSSFVAIGLCLMVLLLPPERALAQLPSKLEQALLDLPMTFTHHQGAAPDCIPNCPEWIAASGRIAKGSLADLKATLAKVGSKKLPIIIDSPGGDVDESYAMGRFIRAKALPVSVGWTKSTPCPFEPSDCKKVRDKKIVYGRPQDRIGRCASSCVFVLAGGVERNFPGDAKAGVHQFKYTMTQARVLERYRMVRKPGSSEPVKEVVSRTVLDEKKFESATPEKSYAKATAYLKEMGVDADIVMTALRSTPHTSIHWFTDAEATSARLKTSNKPAMAFVGLPEHAPMPMTPAMQAEHDATVAKAKARIDARLGPSLECSKQADDQKLTGSERMSFRRGCIEKAKAKK